jgi:CheY-like chemotaxis protein
MKTILLVDDEADVRAVLKMRLERAGYRVLEAQTGLQALEMTYSANPDLVVLDYTLPLMSGLEVLKMFRQTPATADLPVLLVSGVDDALMEQCIDDLKVFASFAKPFSPALVVKKIEEAFGGLDDR